MVRWKLIEYALTDDGIIISLPVWRWKKTWKRGKGRGEVVRYAIMLLPEVIELIRQHLDVVRSVLDEGSEEKRIVVKIYNVRTVQEALEVEREKERASAESLIKDYR
ncbi:MAG: hypothetical protein DRJ40_10900 [Thermoprotei archaeon]|nr:MAG: hypothetical protein DRJ40_10900 [Thermoprotei archaeon]